MEDVISRRRFMKVGLYGSAVLLIPVGPLGCGEDTQGAGEEGQNRTDPSQEEGRFFDNHQYETVDALTGFIIPEDQDPGAVSARVVDYIDFLLGAFKVDPPRIYAAGPFSGRHGGENGFSVYLPLSRVKKISWRVHIEGSKAVPEWEEKTKRDPIEGLQEIYTKGIEALDRISQSLFKAGFKDLEPGQPLAVWRQMDPRFRDTVFEHTVEGMYAAPEYGGNQGLVGWEYIHYEGDRQPIGYTRRQVEEPDEELVGSTLSRQETDEAVAFLQALVRHRHVRTV